MRTGNTVAVQEKKYFFCSGALPPSMPFLSFDGGRGVSRFSVFPSYRRQGKTALRPPAPFPGCLALNVCIHVPISLPLISSLLYVYAIFCFKTPRVFFSISL